MLDEFKDIEITKPSYLAKLEKESKEEFMARIRVCPECGAVNDDILMASMVSRYFETGFFSGMWVHWNEYHLTCKECGCEWVGRKIRS